jgi:hypothetical protein
MDLQNTIDKLVQQNSEWLNMRKNVHRNARLKLDRDYMRRLKEVRRLVVQLKSKIKIK